MTRTLLLATFAAVLAATALAEAEGAAAVAAPAVSGHHDRVQMRRKTARRASRGTGQGITTGGKPSATGGTPGGMPDRQ